MRLASRLSAFFLAALALVLIGFSTALFVSASAYFHRQIDDRLAAAIAVLSASSEVTADGVEWEPDQRELPLGHDAGPSRVRWMVHDGQGHRIDHSRNLNDANLTDAWAPRPGDLSLPRRLVDAQGLGWKIAQKKLVPRAEDTPSGSNAANRSTGTHDLDPSSVLYPYLVLSVAVPIDRIERTLATLGWFLVCLSLGVWGIAALLGRSLIRRALNPLREMVASAKNLDATDAGWSLPSAGTGDELDELGRAFNDLLGRLRIAYERQRRFSSDASHQLRTPLTALIGQIEVALRRERPSEEYRRVLGLVRGQAGHLGQIVEALLFLGRAEAEAALPDFVELDLKDWLARHVEVHPLAPSIQLELTQEPEPLIVRAHPALLGQLLDNLLDNAAKYGRSGELIVVRTLPEHGVAALSVEDSGPGIDPADQPRIFEPFYRSNNARHLGRPGVGLGLAVVQRITAAFGGTIVVESEAGRGCRFILRLPRVQSPRVEHEHRPYLISTSIPHATSDSIS
jgi:heavy metal sensor kinase